MIDSNFIIKYTDALHSAPVNSLPRYDEFRDMFSAGQIRSKEWLVKELKKILPYDTKNSIIIAASWFGTLGMMINKIFPYSNIKLLDIDSRCSTFIDILSRDMKNISSITEDMYVHNYTEDVIINTSCEHIENIENWLSMLPKHSIVILQSNNFINGSGHINCVSSLNEFKQQCNLKNILYAGNLIMPMYTRYMLIGRINE